MTKYDKVTTVRLVISIKLLWDLSKAGLIPRTRNVSQVEIASSKILFSNSDKVFGSTDAQLSSQLLKSINALRFANGDNLISSVSYAFVLWHKIPNIAFTRDSQLLAFLV
ncbi:hypothetical protein CXF86_19740 [Shewanella sp. GutCb]|nr:hypothetical protein CXF86_19740 [Shewanella sp. GutCb]